MYTIEVYKRDGRTRAGERLISKEDLDVPRGDAQGIAEALEMKGFRVELRDTWVTRTNSQTGRDYRNAMTLLVRARPRQTSTGACED